MANLVIRTKGISAHASRVTDKGINAISKMGKILCAIDEIYLPKLKQRKHRLLGIPTYNFGVIEGGTKSNMVAEHCCLHLDCRLLPGQRAEDIRKEIEGLIERLHQEDSYLDATVELRSESPPFEMEESAPLVQQLRKAIEKVKGVDLGITGYYPVSDGRFFAYRHIPTVVFGSGSSLQAHTTDEYVEIDQVIDSAKILALLALNVVC
jgi:acetylornithine deacetylase/succinyl-diaminopimelate desuccinylase-like protein